MYMYVYAYIYMYVRIYVCIYVYMYVYIYERNYGNYPTTYSLILKVQPETVRVYKKPKLVLTNEVAHITAI